MFVIFEGIDTTGKTTQIEKLKESFENVIATREPGGTALGQRLRSILLDGEFELATNAELFIFLADRAQHYEELVAPNREDKMVVSDRCFISGIAYAMTNHPELELGYLLRLNRFAMNGTMPDKIVLFKTTKELLTKRMGNKSHDAIEQRGFDYLLKVQEWMEKVVIRLEVPHLIVDASKSIEEIHKEIKGFLDD